MTKKSSNVRIISAEWTTRAHVSAMEGEMLIRFAFKNFRSVGSDPMTLEMVSSAKVRKLKGHVCPSSGGAKVLRNAVVYGGNAAGKSNLVKALAFMRASVLAGSLPQEGIGEYCRCGGGLAGEETTFDVQFQVEGSVFDYGFTCVLAELRVTSEWLYFLGDEPEPVFLREGSDSVSCDALVSAAADADKVRLGVYTEDFLHEQASSTGSGLLLAYMGKARSFPKESPLSVFRRAFSWFASGVEVIGAGQAAPSTEYYAESSTLDQVAEVLSSFDTGVSGLRKEEVGMDELEKYVPAEVLLTLREVLRANAPKRDDEAFVLTVRNDSFFLGVERTGAGEPRATILKTRHEGSLLDFDFHDESDGTKRLFDFMDILFTKSEDKVFVVDELNRSFHPMLTQQLVSLFNEIHAGDDCQLVFTTHENDIMSYDYFRRDEIWFVERGEDGTSRLYPLDDFAADEARSDARLNKKYLEGRYGGVPVISASRARAALDLGEA